MDQNETSKRVRECEAILSLSVSILQSCNAFFASIEKTFQIIGAHFESSRGEGHLI